MTLREARQQFERDFIVAALERHACRVAPAAAELGMLRPNLYRKCRELGISFSRAAHAPAVTSGQDQARSAKT